MMVESSPMWMGMYFSVSKDEKESLSAIMWFEAPESINYLTFSIPLTTFMNMENVIWPL